jgi:hypothetical protein
VRRELMKSENSDATGREHSTGMRAFNGIGPIL